MMGPPQAPKKFNRAGKSGVPETPIFMNTRDKILVCVDGGYVCPVYPGRGCKSRMSKKCK